MLTADGIKLRADVRDPPWRTSRRGTLILAHATMAQKSEFEQAGFASFFAQRGWRTVAFDFRAGSGRYDDFVRHDLPAMVASARLRTRSGPVVVVGHSLGAHTALASQAVGALGADALVLIAGGIWLRAHEPSATRWFLKRATMRLVAKLAHEAEGLPARLVEEGLWTSADGKTDYAAALPEVTAPVYALSSRGDLLISPPASVAAMLEGIRGPLTSHVIERSDDGTAAPGHLEIVTTDRARSAWERVAAWLERR